MSSPFLGEIRLIGFNFAPRGWAFCDGQLLAISQSTALFALLGTSYGGDGRTTFALPDLRGRVPVHPGSGPGLPRVQQGERGGAAMTTLSTANLPSHSHGVRASNGVQTSNRPKGAYQAAGNSYSTTPDTTMGTTVATGGSQSFENRQPFLGIHYVIALVGVFPSRN